MTFALSYSELGISSFTISFVLIVSAGVLLGLPTFYLLKSGQGKSAL